MTSNYRRKVISGLLTMQILFLILFALGFINLIHNTAIINIGLSATFINWVVIIFSVLSMINVIHELRKVN